jgi:hypothetical protein
MTVRSYTQPQVRALLQMSPTTFRRLLATGRLPWVEEIQPRAGRPRYLAAPLDRYLAGQWTRPQLVFGARRRAR